MEQLTPPPHAAIPLTSRSKKSLGVGKYFFVFAGVLSLFFVLVGFSSSYFVPMATGKFTARPLIHLHGAVFMLWIVFLISQPLLVRLRLTTWHKKVGYAGFALAVLVVLVGVAVAITTCQIKVSNGGGNADKAFLLIPLTDMVLFGVFIGLSMMNLKKIDTHKRLMLLTSLAILPAPFGRMFSMLGFTETSSTDIMMLLLLQWLLLFIAVAYDVFSRRSVHPVYIWGGLALIIVHSVRDALGNTETWISIASWITGT